MLFLVANTKGEKYLVEAANAEDARDAAVLDGGEVVAIIHAKTTEPNELLASELMDLLEKTFDNFMKEPSIEMVLDKMEEGTSVSG